MTATDAAVRRWRPDPMTVAVASLVLLAELAFVTVYLQTRGTAVQRPLLVIGVPFVWINLGLLVFWRVRPAPAGGRRWPAVAVAVAYFGLLAAVGGLLTSSSTGTGGFRVVLDGVPGWIPLVVVPGSLVNLVVVPFKLVGYAALSFLVYVTVRDASGALVGSLLGLLSCVSCTFPLIAAILTGIAGGGTALAAAAYTNSYLLSTVVFAVTVAILAWRPTVGDLPSW